ncbi:MAG: hypothetical protein AB1649_24675 [Chloroflexota bacterium]
MLAVINVLLGIGLIVAGRKLFWLFIAAGGFIAGVRLASEFIGGPEWILLVIGIVTGILFAVLAVFLRVIAIGLAGFFIGGSILTVMAGAMQIENGGGWIVYLIGGIIGIILVSLLFDWALITLSSFAGAALVLQTFNMNPSIIAPLFLFLVVIGIWIQGTVKRRERKDG